MYIDGVEAASKPWTGGASGTDLAYQANTNDHPAEEAAKLALQWTGGNPTYAVPYGTEAGIFRARGIPTVICGPGDISQAHQPNEFVARSQMDACDTFMTKMVRWAER